MRRDRDAGWSPTAIFEMDLKMPDDSPARDAAPSPKPECGIVMPISELDGCPASHWSDVLGIMTDALTQVEFRTQLVSNNGSSPIIQKRIVQNLYFSDIVVCDVSGKNANVMLELGMRLAFDKPVILVKDDKTSYSFDISPLEHLSYPRDLRFGSIVEFKQKLAEKAVALHREATSPNYSGSYLKSFGDFKVAQLDKVEVSSEALVIDEIRNLRMMLETRTSRQEDQSFNYTKPRVFDISAPIENISDAQRFMSILLEIPTVTGAKLGRRTGNVINFTIRVSPASRMTENGLLQAFDIYPKIKQQSDDEIVTILKDVIFSTKS